MGPRAIVGSVDREQTKAEFAAQFAALEAKKKELEALRAELAQERALRLAAEQAVEEERARRIAAEQVVLRMKRDIERLERQLMGPKSERVLDPEDQPLPDPSGGEDDPEDESEEEPAESEPIEGDAKKKRRKGGRRKIADMNELRTVEYRSEAAKQLCPCGCGARGRAIGEEISWRLEYEPAKLYRIRLVREKAAFPDHEGPGPATVVTPEPPGIAFALPRAMCGNSLLAQIAIDKYADSLPLFRQEQRFERLGVSLSRSTMCDWMMALATFLEPIWKHMSREVLSGTWLRADAASHPVKDATRVRGKVHRGHLWAFGNYETVLFKYTPDKTAVTVASLFPGFKGTVLIDGASDFNLLEKTEGVVRAGCWAHARRYLYEALKHDRKLALRGLGAIRELFLAERLVMAAPVEARTAMRDELCKPVLEGIRHWVTEQLPRQVPGSPGHAALQYIDNQWDRLLVFLTTPKIACSNNDTERDLRRPVKGRVNWHYYENPGGAKAAAVYYSFVGTCMLQGIDPLKYFVEIFGRLDEPPAALTPHAIREQWQRAANPSK